MAGETTVEFQFDDADPRLGTLTPTLVGLMDAVVSLDSSLGQVAPAAPYLRQIVKTSGGGAWYVVVAPHRAGRPRAGNGGRPEDSPIFLDNVRTLGKQSWATFTLGDAHLVALANPSPHLPGTVTLTRSSLDVQSWRASGRSPDAGRIRAVAALMVAIADNAPGRYVSFNNEGSGNSLSQFHVSVNAYPVGVHAWPVERVIADQAGRARDGWLVLGTRGEYPVPTIVVSGRLDELVDRLASVIGEWDTQPDRTGNIVVRRTNTNEATAIFWPRSRAWRHAPGFHSGEIGFMELSGCFVLSDDRDTANVDSGRYGYRHFWNVLRAVADDRAFAFADRLRAAHLP